MATSSVIGCGEPPVDYRILGPLEVIGDDGEALALGGVRERALLATLLLNAGTVVSSSRLIDALWGENPPTTATNTLQGHISKLRRKLAAAGADVLRSAPRGYVLEIPPEEFDLARFEVLAREVVDDTSREQKRLRQALTLWRGPALDDVESDLLEGERTRLEELRMTTLERRIETDLALGHHAEIIPELETLVHQLPMREKLRSQLMLALYRSGRQAEALAVYKAGRELLAEELGIDPSPELQGLELAILNQDQELSASGTTQTMSAVEHNLPVQLTSFIGREREIEEIHRLVDESRLVSLVGPGGSGKTRLALQVAADLLGLSRHAVWLVDLSALRAPDQVAREVASVLGVAEEASRPLLGTLVESLKYQELFLMLDNCEHLIDAAAKVAETIVCRCPKVSVLATSRESLGVEGERIYRVPPLRLPDDVEVEQSPEGIASVEAVKLFVERAKERRPGFSLDAKNASTVVSLCRHLDGIPLALELAAAEVFSMSVEDVERRLSQRFRLLSGGSRTRSSRQQTLEGAIEWSYGLLNDREKQVFACLSVFPASFDLAAAESICAKATSIDELDVVHLVRVLVDKSLLQTEQGASGLRYRMLETIVHYAAARMAESADNLALRAREAHALHFLRFVEEAARHLTGADQIEWMTKLEADYDNIRTAGSFLAAGPGHGLEALSLVNSLRTLWWVGLGGTAGEARDLARAALAHPEAQSATKERSGALLSLGLVEGSMGEVDVARASLQAGLAMAREVGESTLAAEHLCSLAFLLYRLGENDRAKATAEEALEVAETVGDPNLRAWAHDRMGVAGQIDEPEAARLHFVEALRLYERPGDRWKISTTYNNLGNLEMIEGDLAAARSNLEAALEYAGTPRHRAIVLNNLGLINLLEGNPEPAESDHLDALRQLVRSGAFIEVPCALLGLAVCSGAVGNLERSAALHGAADAMVEAQNTPFEPFEAGLRANDIAALRQQMGESAFEAAYSRGLGMLGPDVIELALAPGARSSADGP